MPRLKVLSGKDVIKTLRRFGFVVVSQGGSHVRVRFGNCSITIPLHKELGRKTMLEIYRQLEPSLSKASLNDIFYTK